MDAEHLEYFEAALEGRATLSWNVWFAANPQVLPQQLSRPSLLRLKFSKLDEAERLPAEAGIVPRSTTGKRYEMYCAEFSADVVDAKDRLLPAIWRAAVPSACWPMVSRRQGKRSCSRSSPASASASCNRPASGWLICALKARWN